MYIYICMYAHLGVGNDAPVFDVEAKHCLPASPGLGFRQLLLRFLPLAPLYRHMCQCSG